MHAQKLGNIYDWAVSQDKTLIVVVFPDMLRVDETHDLGDKVTTFYHNLGIPVIDVAELVKDIPAQRRIVNTVDTHASAEAQAIVAEALKTVVLSLETTKISD